MAATHTPNINLNKPDRMDLVSVVTDLNDNMDTLDDAIGALPTGRTLQGQINTLKPITITIDPVTNASGAYTHTTNDARVTEGLKATGIEVGTPETFRAPIRITTGNGTIELYCANAVGSSTVTVTLEESTPIDSADPQPASVTSTEFDILANRIGTLSNLHTTNKTSLVDATNEVSDQIATKTATVTFVANKTEGSNFSAKKSGNIVCLNGRILTSDNTTLRNGGILATLPDGFRPSVQTKCGCVCSNDNGSQSYYFGININTNGTIETNQGTGTMASGVYFGFYISYCV